MAYSSPLRRFVASGQLVATSAGSYLPSNVLRIAVLRATGMHFGRGAVVHHGLAVRAAQKVWVGDDVWIDEDVRLDGRGGLSIGSSVSIGAGVQVWTAEHDWRSQEFGYVSAPVRIGHHAWICARSIVLPGVTIGAGSVVAAGAVVAADVAPWTVVGGVPSRPIADRPRDLQYTLDARRNKMFWW